MARVSRCSSLDARDIGLTSRGSGRGADNDGLAASRPVFARRDLLVARSHDFVIRGFDRLRIRPGGVAPPYDARGGRGVVVWMIGVAGVCWLLRLFARWQTGLYVDAPDKPLLFLPRHFVPDFWLNNVALSAMFADVDLSCHTVPLGWVLILRNSDSVPFGVDLGAVMDCAGLAGITGAGRFALSTAKQISLK